MTIGSFCLVKNEVAWIGAHLMSWLPVLDQVVLFDGNSTDGTLEVIRHLQATHRQGYKIKLVEDRDPVDLREDYVRLFNECLWSLDTDLAAFLHPDMICLAPGRLRELDAPIAASVRVRSFGGEPDGSWYEAKGRAAAWKNIYRLRPSLGAHYHGFYGAWNEDVYFSDITGDEHQAFPAEEMARYPYEVVDSGAEVAHFSDVRSYARRLERMTRCLLNQGHSPEKAAEMAPKHPRVTLTEGADPAGNKIEWACAPRELVSEIRAAQEKFKEVVTQ